MKQVLIAGAGSGIGIALAETYSKQGYKVLTISRQPSDSNSHLCCDLSQAESVNTVQQWLAKQAPITIVFTCFGFLHDDHIRPEKQLRQLTAANLSKSIEINVMCHVHMAQAFQGFVNQQTPLHWLALSAMVGSIEDNGLGGWHSYRMSKAALNMFIKNLSIEWQRKSPISVVCAIHPGTTITALSKPFTRSTPANKLYEARLTAERLFSVEQSLNASKHGKLLHWNGEILPF